MNLHVPLRSLSERTKVKFAQNPAELLKAYVDSGEGLDRAGGFAIQVSDSGISEYRMLSAGICATYFLSERLGGHADAASPPPPSVVLTTNLLDVRGATSHIARPMRFVASLHTTSPWQGRGGLLVRSIEGDFNNVVGFPLFSFFAFLHELAETEQLFDDEE